MKIALAPSGPAAPCGGGVNAAWIAAMPAANVAASQVLRRLASAFALASASSDSA